MNVKWRQNTDEVIVKVPVGADVRGRDVQFDIHPTRLKLTVKGTPLLEGGLTDAGEVNVDSTCSAPVAPLAVPQVCTPARAQSVAALC